MTCKSIYTNLQPVLECNSMACVEFYGLTWINYWSPLSLSLSLALSHRNTGHNRSLVLQHTILFPSFLALQMNFCHALYLLLLNFVSWNKLQQNTTLSLSLSPLPFYFICFCSLKLQCFCFSLPLCKQEEQQNLPSHNWALANFAKTHGIEVIDTFNITIARFKEFYPGKCACHFHSVSDFFKCFPFLLPDSPFAREFLLHSARKGPSVS